MSARSLRSGSATNQTGWRPPLFQYSTASSHSRLGGEGNRPSRGGPAGAVHSSGRRKSNAARRCMASTGACDGSADARALVMSARSRKVGACALAYPESAS